MSGGGPSNSFTATEEQQSIVSALEDLAKTPYGEWQRKLLRVIAGPGTGKSTTIASAVAAFVTTFPEQLPPVAPPPPPQNSQQLLGNNSLEEAERSSSFSSGFLPLTRKVILPSFGNSTKTELEKKLANFDCAGRAEQITFHSVAKHKLTLDKHFIVRNFAKFLKFGHDSKDFLPTGTIKGWVNKSINITGAQGVTDKQVESLVKTLNIMVRKMMKESWAGFLASDSFHPEVQVSKWQKEKVLNMVTKRLTPRPHPGGGGRNNSKSNNKLTTSEIELVSAQIAETYESEATKTVQGQCAAFWRLHLDWLKRGGKYELLPGQNNLSEECQWVGFDGYQKLVFVVLKARAEKVEKLWEPRKQLRSAITDRNPCLSVNIRGLKTNSNLDFGPSLVTTKDEITLEDVTHRIKPPHIGEGVVIVDEAQDLNPVQFALATLFWPKMSLMMVGDPMQSIYGWRGAMPEHFMKFGEADSCLNFQLTTSFRFLPTHSDVYNVYLRLVYDTRNEKEVNRIQLTSARTSHRSSEKPPHAAGKVLLKCGEEMQKISDLFSYLGRNCPEHIRNALVIYRGNSAALGAAIDFSFQEKHPALKLRLRKENSGSMYGLGSIELACRMFLQFTNQQSPHRDSELHRQAKSHPPLKRHLDRNRSYFTEEPWELVQTWPSDHQSWGVIVERCEEILDPESSSEMDDEDEDDEVAEELEREEFSRDFCAAVLIVRDAWTQFQNNPPSEEEDPNQEVAAGVVPPTTTETRTYGSLPEEIRFIEFFYDQIALLRDHGIPSRNWDDQNNNTDRGPNLLTFTNPHQIKGGEEDAVIVAPKGFSGCPKIPKRNTRKMTGVGLGGGGTGGPNDQPLFMGGGGKQTESSKGSDGTVLPKLTTSSVDEIGAFFVAMTRVKDCLMLPGPMLDLYEAWLAKKKKEDKMHDLESEMKREMKKEDVQNIKVKEEEEEEEERLADAPLLGTGSSSFNLQSIKTERSFSRSKRSREDEDSNDEVKQQEEEEEEDELIPRPQTQTSQQQFKSLLPIDGTDTGAFVDDQPPRPPLLIPGPPPETQAGALIRAEQQQVFPSRLPSMDRIQVPIGRAGSLVLQSGENSTGSYHYGPLQTSAPNSSTKKKPITSNTNSSSKVVSGEEAARHNNNMVVTSDNCVNNGRSSDYLNLYDCDSTLLQAPPPPPMPLNLQGAADHLSQRSEEEYSSQKDDNDDDDEDDRLPPLSQPGLRPHRRTSTFVVDLTQSPPGANDGGGGAGGSEEEGDAPPLMSGGAHQEDTDDNLPLSNNQPAGGAAPSSRQSSMNRQASKISDLLKPYKTTPPGMKKKNKKKATTTATVKKRTGESKNTKSKKEN